MNHEHSPELQKQYFQFAYQTGSDIWSHIPYRFIAESMLPLFPKDSLVLDIGGGRGLWALRLLEAGYRVLGIDYVSSIVETVNYRISEEGYTGRGRFITADALDIPFANSSFKLATDIGTLQHIQMKDWEKYADEVKRILEPGAYYLNVSLSRNTHRFAGLEPRKSSTGEFKKFGMYYYFFTDREIQHLFDEDFDIIEQRHQSFESKSDPGDEIVLLFSLMKKKK